MKKKWRWLLLILLILAVFVIIAFLILENSRSFPVSASDNVNIDSLKELNLSTIDKKDTTNPLLPAFKPSDCIVRHRYYTLCYIEANEQPGWVAYKLTSSMLTATAKRKDNFRIDPFINTASATPADYSKSGYDKGHLCPAADMSFSDEAMSETFFMSNMSPQTPQFNRGIWKVLEEKVREWARVNKELYVTTGPVFTQASIHIGKNEVAVPQYYYKVILDYKSPDIKGVGFIMKNEGSNKKIWDFAVSIDSVEKFTGIDFFTALPDEEEKAIEENFKQKNW